MRQVEMERRHRDIALFDRLQIGRRLRRMRHLAEAEPVISEAARIDPLVELGAAIIAQALADYRSSLASLGKPKSFERTHSAVRGGFTDEGYTVAFAARKLKIVLRAEPGPKGRIEQFTVYPAD